MIVSFSVEFFIVKSFKKTPNIARRAPNNISNHFAFSSLLASQVLRIHRSKRVYCIRSSADVEHSKNKLLNVWKKRLRVWMKMGWMKFLSEIRTPYVLQRFQFISSVTERNKEIGSKDGRKITLKLPKLHRQQQTKFHYFDV